MFCRRLILSHSGSSSEASGFRTYAPSLTTCDSGRLLLRRVHSGNARLSPRLPIRAEYIPLLRNDRRISNTTTQQHPQSHTRKAAQTIPRGRIRADDGCSPAHRPQRHRQHSQNEKKVSYYVGKCKSGHWILHYPLKEGSPLCASSQRFVLALWGSRVMGLS